ncbi:hypothetical protein R3I94_003732 [Phoxinus phoxinus]
MPMNTIICGVFTGAALKYWMLMIV